MNVFLLRSRQHAWLLVLPILVLTVQKSDGFTTAVPRTSSLRVGRRNGYHIRDQRLLLVFQGTPLTKDEGVNGDIKDEEKPKIRVPRQHFFTAMPRKAIQIYSDYASRLWIETSPVARRRIASDRIAQSIRQVQHVFRGEEYCDYSHVSAKDRQNLLDACDSILADNERAMRAADTEEIEKAKAKDIAVATRGDDATAKAKATAEDAPAATKKQGRSLLFGATMGGVVAAWVFSGNYIFTGVFMALTILGQLEYYRMVMNTGVYPARLISIIGSASMFLTALFFPNVHQICLPLFGLCAIIQLLFDRTNSPTISDIATSFSGMFYLGYAPSFWVRIRHMGSREPTRLAPLAAPVLEFLKKFADVKLPRFVPKAIHLPITNGAIFIFWSWLSLAFSDVGAYFAGRKFGKTKLGVVSAAMGKTSPNKTVEGVIGGCILSAMFSTLGAWVQKWPFWPITGAIHGVLLGFLGLIGDLTASMLKRDAGLKDFGDLIPEHGGILDRVDSYVWSAPYSYFFYTTILPALRSMR